MPEISRFLGIVITNWTTLAEEGIFRRIAPLV
jgi:hypothetical protein